MKVLSLIGSVIVLLIVGCAPVQHREGTALTTNEREDPVLSDTIDLQTSKKDIMSSDTIKLETSMGDIVIALDREKAPVTVDNFLQYVAEKHFDDTIFHRVISGFMIQGGGFSADHKQKDTRATIVNEASNGLKNFRGTIAMARTSDPDSASSQFFINHKDNANLNYGGSRGAGYTVFGKVTEGMDVVDKIAAVKTGTRTVTVLAPRGGQKVEISQPFRDVPVEPVVVKSVTVVSK